MAENKGIIFDISRFCLNDGPGIRTTVFLKGCPLRCQWCHNPESQNSKPEILYARQLCVNCGACVSVCPSGCHDLKEKHIFNRTDCIGCGVCATNCPAAALRLVGRLCTAEEVIEEVLRDKVYYEESGGGITVSGGEPMMQVDFLEKFLCLAKQIGIHTCIETCGFAPKKTFARIAPLTDCFLFDWKESDPERHRLFTGADNQLIQSNLSFLNDIGAEIVLRLPLIPGFNDRREHIEGTAQIVNLYTRIKRIEIMPYHPLGISKARELDHIEPEKLPAIPNKTLLDEFIRELRTKVNVTIEAIV